MPLAFPKGSRSYNSFRISATNLISQLKRFKDKVEWHNKYELDTSEGIINRVKMLCNIAIALHTIHSTGRYVLVDLKPENIDATGAGKVSIMDTDSIQISENGKILYPATAFTPEYFAPEGKELKRLNRPFTLQCDYFAAAICFYQILTGTHPYSGTVLKSPYDNCTEIADCISNGLFAFGEKQNILICHLHSIYSRIFIIYLRRFKDSSNVPLVHRHLNVRRWRSGAYFSRDYQRRYQSRAICCQA